MLRQIICTGLIICGLLTIRAEEKMEKDENKYKKGLKKLAEIDGEAGERVIESLKNISPELGDYIIEFVFGEIYCRGVISDKERELAVIAALASMGNAVPQLKVHLHAALNTGSSPAEIVQILCHISAYAGIPVSLNSLAYFNEVLKHRNMEYKAGESKPVNNEKIKEQGEARLEKLIPGQVKNLNVVYEEFAPEIRDYIILSYGYLLDEEKLPFRARQIATIASLTALGTATPQLKLHMKAGLNIGLSIEEIKEVIITMSVYAGFPAALNATYLLKEIKEGK